jgi:hypothetical protein
VAKLASEGAPAGVGDPAREAPVLQHPGHVELLDHQRSGVAREPGGELRQPVGAQVGDPVVALVAGVVGPQPTARRNLSGAPIPPAPTGTPAVQPPQALL